MRKTAIFGGTFNPPHNGHMAMVKDILEMENIDRVLVMPAKIPPHKTSHIASAEDRVAMCQLAFGDIAGAELCLDELELPGKSYTVQTLEFLKTKGIVQPIFIIGGDSLRDFHEWHRYTDILKLAEIYAYRRSGVDDGDVLSAKSKLERLGGKITILDICPPDISSTEIREKIASGELADDMIPPKVVDYIKNNKLYVGE